MKIKRITLALLALLLLACNAVTRIVFPPTATPVPTSTPTVTASPSPSPTPTQLVPAYVPPQCESQPIATLSPDAAAQAATDPNIKEISKRKQLRILNEIDSIVQDVYIYPDYNGKDWNEIVARYRAMIEEGMDTQTFYYRMQDMITELGDDHSAFYSPIDVDFSEAELEGKAKFVGVGVYSDVDYETGSVVVISTFPGSPAEYAGLQPHDRILLIDGLPVTADGGFRMRGPECTAVVLRVQSPGESPRDLILFRSPIEGNIPIDARIVPTTDGTKIGYIFIPSFFDETIPQQIEDALNGFGDLDGLILDVRMNGGGSLAVGNDILEFFTNGKMGAFKSRDETKDLILDANPVHNSQTVPLVVLVNERTASFSELFAGLLRDTRGARITGTTSPGNVEVLNGYNIEDGSQLWIAASKFDSAFSDDDWEQTGIVTDVEAYADWGSFQFETDPSIAEALRLLGH